MKTAAIAEWGSCWGESGTNSCYLESVDGLKWTEACAGYGPRRQQGHQLARRPERTVFVDPSAAPAERYKAVTLNDMSFVDFEAYKKARPDGWEPRARRDDVGHVYYIQGAVSPDGTHWTALAEPFVVEHSDTQIVAYYDARLRKYVIYTRGWMVGVQSPTSQPGEGRDWYGVGRRSIGRTESADFRRFPLSNLIMVPPSDWPPSDVLYTNCRTSIPGRPTSTSCSRQCGGRRTTRRMWSWPPATTASRGAMFPEVRWLRRHRSATGRRMHLCPA